MHGEVNGLKEDVLRLSRESSAQSLIKVSSDLLDCMCHNNISSSASSSSSNSRDSSC